MRKAMAGLLAVELLCGADIFFLNNPRGFSLATDVKAKFEEENAGRDEFDQEKPAKKLDADALRRIQMREKRRFARLEKDFKRFQLAAYVLFACLASIGFWLLLAVVGRPPRRQLLPRRIVIWGLRGAILAGATLIGLFGIAFLLSNYRTPIWDRLDWETCWLMGTLCGGVSGSTFALIAFAIDKLAGRAHSQEPRAPGQRP